MRAMLLAMIGALSLAGGANIAEARGHPPALVVTRAWSRPTPPGAPTAAGYLTIVNNSAEPDRLVSADTPVAPTLGLHSLSNAGGVMRMRAMPEGLVIDPHATVSLDPSGYHLMFEGLTKPFKFGETVPAVLHFEHAGAVAVRFAVGSGAPGMPVP
jgi:copper(I)-binding protein